ncbi:MAG: ferritin-like domain-containing protein [Acidimicrobiales bacterium]
MTFDLDSYKARSSRLRLDDIDFGSFSIAPLRLGALRCLRYMHDVEYHTACYLRDILVTPAHVDPEVTAFLSVWAYEELFHGEALARVLGAHGEVHGAPRVAELRADLGWRDKARPLVMAAGGWWAGSDLVALQMAWGALNESMTQTGYYLLARRAGHPVLSELLARIQRQEAMHLAFYMSQAGSRLAASPRARRLARHALARLWRPVGSGVMPAGETTFLLTYLMGDAEGRSRAARIDRQVDTLPGLAGLGLIGRSLSRLSPTRDDASHDQLAA